MGTDKRIGHLVVIFEKRDSATRVRVEKRCAAGRVLPGVVLSLVEETVFCSRNKLLGVAEVVGVIGLASASESHECGVMEVVVPHSVKSAAFGRGKNLAVELTLAFAKEHDAAISSDCPGGAGDRCQNVLAMGPAIADGLRGIKAQAIEVIVANPLLGVLDEKVADGKTMLSVEVGCVAPLCLAGKVVG